MTTTIEENLAVAEIKRRFCPPVACPCRRLILTVCLSFLVLFGCSSEDKQQQAPPVVSVEVTDVKKAPLDRTLTSVGTLSSPQETLLASQIDGRITALHISQGAVANRETLLVVLEDSLQKTAVQTAEAELFNARQIYQREQQIKDTGGISEQQLQSHEAAVRRTEALLKQAQVNLDYTRIRAPFRGSLGLRRVSVGDFVRAGDPLVSLNQIAPLYLDFEIPQQEISRIGAGQTAEFSVSGLNGSFKGEVTTVDSSLLSRSRSLRLQATVSNVERRLRPGMFARVNLVVETIPEALFIPMQALVAEGQINHVWVVGADGKAKRKKVEVGEYQDNLVQIRSGLELDDQVVVSGVQKLRPGASLKVSPYEPISNPRLDLSAPDPKAPP